MANKLGARPPVMNEDPMRSGFAGSNLPQLNIRQLLIMSKGKMPVIHEYDPKNPDVFWKELRTRELWQRGYSLPFFQDALGIATTSVAVRIFKKLEDFIGKKKFYFYDETGTKKAMIPQNTLSSYLQGRRKWSRTALALVCLALGVNHNDQEKKCAKALFSLLGLTYARFADPVDIIYAWAMEYDYNYEQLIHLFDSAKDICFDLKMAYEELRIPNRLERLTRLTDEIEREETAPPTKPIFKVLDDKVMEQQANYEEWKNYLREIRAEAAELESARRPIDYMETYLMEEDFRSIWNSSESVLLQCLNDYKDEFHLCSVTRAKIVDELIDGSTNIGNFTAMIDGDKRVSREDIIFLAIENGSDLTQINRHLERANFAPIGPSGEDERDELFWAGLTR